MVPDRGWVVSAVSVIALLYFGRPVLEPLVVAALFSMALLPLVRRLRELGLGQTAAALVSVLCVGACVVGLGVILAIQLADVAHELPRYRAAVEKKFEQLSGTALAPIERWEADVITLVPERREQAASERLGSPSVAPVPVEIRPPVPTVGETLAKLFAAVWGPIGESVIVLVLLTLILLAHESVRERLIRLTGEADVGRTMQALADTDEGVSHFFFSLFLVNAMFAAVVACALAAVGTRHAMLWGGLAGILRFVPYVGVPIVAAIVALFAAATDPGWLLALWSIAIFVALELGVAYVVEPRVYGQTTGLAPTAIIVAALFWGALWGLVGLLVSTPLTLCLVVAGRHVKALAPITILFGDKPSTALAQRFYVRALAGDAQDVLDDARAYVRRNGLARYCDDVLLPAIALGAADWRSGEVGAKQQERIRTLIVNLVESVRGGRPRFKPSIVEASLGLQLRKLREARLGPWQGSLDVPAHSVTLCMGFATKRDDLLVELLVRALRDADIDARSADLQSSPPQLDESKAELVSCIIFIDPVTADLASWREAVGRVRHQLPNAFTAVVRTPCAVDEEVPDVAQIRNEVDLVLNSFSEVAVFASRRDRPAVDPTG